MGYGNHGPSQTSGGRGWGVMSEDLRSGAGGFAAGSKAGRYALEEQIGHGGMAAVFKARDEQLGRDVALKVLAPTLAADHAFRQRVIRESRAAAAVDDPHIIRLYEAGDADRASFIAMESDTMNDSFTAELWRDIRDIYAAILAHPFVAGLADDSLPPESFEFYVIQDALFLRKYAQALAVVASKAPNAEMTEMFARHAAGIVSAEMTLHQSLFAELGFDPTAAASAHEAPTTLAYASYLLATTCNGSYGEGVGAVLPCYWIYWEVGKHLIRRGSPNPRYQRWIDMYAAEEFGDQARELIAVTDRLSLSDPERDRIRCHFRATSRYEWMFWDMAYRRERWSV
jgi:thiaminase/transcriptional activator TenA